MTRARRDQILSALKASKPYREAFVSAEIRRGIPTQVRFSRKARNLTQKALAERAGMKQGSISVQEDPNYGKLTVSTLLKLAKGLDVGLLVTFVSFDQLASWAAGEPVNISAENVEVPTFEDDADAAGDAEWLSAIAVERMRMAEAREEGWRERTEAAEKVTHDTLRRLAVAREALMAIADMGSGPGLDTVAREILAAIDTPEQAP